MSKLSESLEALLQRRAKLINERKADPLSKLDAEIAELQIAAEQEAKLKADAERAARLENLREREKKAAESMVALCDQLAQVQAEYITVSREEYSLNARPTVPAVPLQFNVSDLMRGWRHSLQPPTAAELAELAAARVQRAHILARELEDVVGIRRELEEPSEPHPWANKSAAISVQRDYPTQVAGLEEHIMELAVELRALTGSWPNAARAWVTEP